MPSSSKISSSQELINEANKLFLNKKFTSAAHIYGELYKKWPFEVYRTAQEKCIKMGGEEGQPVSNSKELPALKKLSTICVCSSGLIGPTGAGGIATAMTNLAVELTKAGYIVSVIYAAHPYYARENYDYWKKKYKELYGIDFIAINKDKYYGTEEMIRSYEVFRLLKYRNFDAAIFHDYQGLGYFSAIAKKCGILDQTSIIINGHGNQELSYTFGSKIRTTVSECVTRQIEIGSIAHADAFVTPSSFYLDFWKKLTSTPDESRVIHNFNEEATEVALLEGQSRVSVKRRVFDTKKSHYFFYSRLERLKGLDLFIQFSLRKSEEDQSAAFWFYGTPVEIDGVKSDTYINEKLKNSDVKYQIILHPKPSEFFDDIRNAQGILLFCSLGENSPCTVVEACNHDTPLLSADIPGVVELLDDSSRTECLFKTGSVDDLLKSTRDIDFKTKVPSLGYKHSELIKKWDATLNFSHSPKIVEYAQPKVSVVIPTIGRLETIKETLDAFRAQDYSDLELIVVDDSGSKEVELRSTCLEYSAIYQKTEMIFKAGACNLGARSATGEIIIFFDDDDIPYPNYVSAMVRAFGVSNADVVSTFAAVFTDAKGVAAQDCVEYVSMAVGGTLDLNLMANYFGKGCFGVRSDFFRKIGGYDVDEDLTPFVDYRFYMKCAINDGAILVIPEPLYLYRKNSTGSLFSEMSKTPLLYSAKSKIFDIVKQKVDPSLHMPLRFLIENSTLPKMGAAK